MFPQRRGDVEDRLVLLHVGQREREHRQLVPGGEQPERPELGDARGQGDGDVAAVLLDAVVAGEPVVQEQSRPFCTVTRQCSSLLVGAR